MTDREPIESTRLGLQAYFDRIGFTGLPEVNFETLAALQRHHLFSIPYENIDVQFGRPVSRDIAQIFYKLVTEQRGGWCQNQSFPAPDQ